jgi:ribonuclease III
VKAIPDPFESLKRRIGIDFADPFLLEVALTHRSFGLPNNERLEFLGDGVLNCAIADMLYRKFGELPEGDLSRLRANLVRQETLYQVALSLELGGQLKLGEGELKSGGMSRPSILADAVEALLGAVYLDHGFDSTIALVARLYGPMIDNLDPEKEIKDAKTRLQEALQAQKMPLPAYMLEATTGEAHAQQFTISCSVPNLDIMTRSTGSSRRIAEQRAAELALEKMAEATQGTRGGRR